MPRETVHRKIYRISGLSLAILAALMMTVFLIRAAAETTGISAETLIAADQNFAGKKASGSVEINMVNFPDDTFLSYVRRFDTDGDSQLSRAELARVNTILVSNRGVKSLKGIEYFTGLNKLKCESNAITALDLTQNIYLREIYCKDNYLCSIELGKNAELEFLDCRFNRCTIIDLSGCPLLISRMQILEIADSYTRRYSYFDSELQQYSESLHFDSSARLITDPAEAEDPYADAWVTKEREETELSLTLDALQYDVENIEVDTLMELIADQNPGFEVPGSSDKIYWKSDISSDCRFLAGTDTVNCAENTAYKFRDSFNFGEYGYYYSDIFDNEFCLIIGSGKQLDNEDILYVIYTDIINYVKVGDLSFSLTKQDSGGNLSSVVNYDDKAIDRYYFDYGKTNKFIASAYSDIPLENDEKLLISICSESARSLPGIKLLVYDEEHNDITDQIFDPQSVDASAGYAAADKFTTDRSFTLEYYCGERLIDTCIFNYSNSTSMHVSGVIPWTIDPSSGNRYHLDVYEENVTETGNEEMIPVAMDGYTTGTEVFLALELNGEPLNAGLPYIVKTVIGNFAKQEDAEQAEDISARIFSEDGYPVTYSGDPVTVTIFLKDGSVFKKHFDFIDKFNSPYSKSLNFYISGALASDGTQLVYGSNCKRLAREASGKDSLNMYYQTVFVLEPEVDLSRIRPYFFCPEGCVVHVGGKVQVSGESEVDFSKGYVHYQVDMPGVGVQNYYVRFVPICHGESKLLVEGPAEERFIGLFWGDNFDWHDIRIINIGDKVLSDIEVSLENAENIKLDDYYSIGGEKNDRLNRFTLSDSDNEIDERSAGTIRLIPTGKGDISGTLVINAKGQETVRIRLTGISDTLKIISDTIDDAVKYVPYSYIVPTNKYYPWIGASFSLEGRLPEGVDFYNNTGEIYGVPRETGVFPLKVTVRFTDNRMNTELIGLDDYTFDEYSMDYVLTVKDNTNVNVYIATDEGYRILDHIGTDAGGYDFVLTDTNSHIFRSEGEFVEFVALWLNGERLEIGIDYDAESGSTKITIDSQTFENKVRYDELNTIAAEFCTYQTVGSDLNTVSELKRTSQNFRIVITPAENIPDNNPESNPQIIPESNPENNPQNHTVNNQDISPGNAAVSSSKANTRKIQETASARSSQRGDSTSRNINAAEQTEQNTAAEQTEQYAAAAYTPDDEEETTQPDSEEPESTISDDTDNDGFDFSGILKYLTLALPAVIAVALFIWLRR